MKNGWLKFKHNMIESTIMSILLIQLSHLMGKNASGNNKLNYSVHLTSNWLTLKSGDHFLYVLSNRGEHLQESGKATFRNLLDELINQSDP
jgi:hypothetical protein